MDRYTGTHTHHYGLLAGLGAGAAAVLGAFVFLASVWQRVSGQVAVAVDVIVWAVASAFLAAALFVPVYLFLRLRHHLAHPETLTRHTVRAGVIPPPPAAELPAQAPLAALPAPGPHYHFETAEAVEAALRAISGTERN